MKGRWMMLLWGFVAGVLVCGLVPLVVLATGMVNVGADTTPGLIERKLAPWALMRSVKRLAPREKNPYVGNAEAIASGMEHFRQNCLPCHGAGEVMGAEFSEGLNPIAPMLDNEGAVTDGELFWIVKHGIRMTAMPAFGPTHNDDEIRKIVAFVRHLPDLTKAEMEALKPVGDAAAHHHQEGKGKP